MKYDVWFTDGDGDEARIEAPTPTRAAEAFAEHYWRPARNGEKIKVSLVRVGYKRASQLEVEAHVSFSIRELSSEK